jgi:uncharacterized Zn-finger protein
MPAAVCTHAHRGLQWGWCAAVHQEYMCSNTELSMHAQDIQLQCDGPKPKNVQPECYHEIERTVGFLFEQPVNR